MKLKSELSLAEQKMFAALGFSNLFEAPISSVGVYRLAVEECFIKNDQSNAANALRLAFKRIYTGKYRGCIEHDNIIESELNKQ